GYRRAADGMRLENLDLEAQLPFVAKAMAAPSLVAYPNGRICPVHDSWATSRTIAPREQTSSTLLPGFGHASLGRGRGENQLQAQMHFSGGYGHSHADNLHFALFAKGSELLSDIGYTHSKLRRWTVSTIGHNLVAIDRQDQTTRDADGDLLMFVPDLNGLAVVEARGERGYPKLAEVYRRELILVPVSETDAYVVDIFRVKGGSTHDWLLHGSADADMAAECSLPLTPREGTMLEPGEKWVEPLGESSSFIPYGLMREVRQAKAEGGFSVAFRFAKGDAGVRVHLLDGHGKDSVPTEVFLCQTPRIRQAEGDDRKAYDYWMPQVVARRRGPAPLTSAFVAVHEPFKPSAAGGFVREVRALPLDPPAEFGVALEVLHGEFTDTILSLPDPVGERRLPNGVVARARLAVVREQGGKVVAAWLVDGTQVSKGDFTLKLEEPRYEGVIESATRKADGAAEDAFVTSAALPSGDSLAGHWMVVTHGNGYTHGYEIRCVERHDGKSFIILCDDHGLKITGDQTEELYFPRRKIAGRNRFVVMGATAYAEKP
ncbi:MAG: hypothetical protein FJ279_20085, partial [Planctomycetes bacterium]|nr:hypothetical protein [Planctomycetota bacterium]